MEPVTANQIANSPKIAAATRTTARCRRQVARIT
jgi:hypothetical protein